MSSGNFHGLKGFLHMMELLQQSQIKIRISVLCSGSEDMCQEKGHYSDIAMATGGIFVNVEPTRSTENQAGQIAICTNHIHLPIGEKATFAAKENKKYLRLLASGKGLALPGYDHVDETLWSDSVNKKQGHHKEERADSSSASSSTLNRRSKRGFYTREL
ncbi:hypothetical protein ACA910_008392 [Epithemia clementina (nom. ined.)]